MNRRPPCPTCLETARHKTTCGNADDCVLCGDVARVGSVLCETCADLMSESYRKPAEATEAIR